MAGQTKIRLLIGAAALALLAAAAGRQEAAPAQSRFADVSDTHLPAGVLDGLIMDAKPADIDGDGDLDIILAHEFEPNIILINDGTGRFADESRERLAQRAHDSEDVAAEDFDGDGDIDVVIVTEDDKTNEYHENTGQGRFGDISDRFPVDGVSNGVWAADVDGDGDADLLIANNGPNVLLINEKGVFSDVSADRLPLLDDVSQDIETGDVDGDGDVDILVGNESRNRLLIQQEDGRFSDETDSRLPVPPKPGETREADFGDADGDGDLDIAVGNTRFFNDASAAENQLLFNDGSGHFTDATAANLPEHGDLTVDIDFADIDLDGDLDLLTANLKYRSIFDRRSPLRLFENDGRGRFIDVTEKWLPDSAKGLGFDVEVADFNGDGLPDIYLASRGSADKLLLQKPPGENKRGGGAK